MLIPIVRTVREHLTPSVDGASQRSLGVVCRDVIAGRIGHVNVSFLIQLNSFRPVDSVLYLKHLLSARGVFHPGRRRVIGDIHIVLLIEGNSRGSSLVGRAVRTSFFLGIAGQELTYVVADDGVVARGLRSCFLGTGTETSVNVLPVDDQSPGGEEGESAFVLSECLHELIVDIKCDNAVGAVVGYVKVAIGIYRQP